MLVDAVILSLVIGWLRGGRIGRLADISLVHFWLVPVALLLRAGPVFLASMGSAAAERYGSASQVVGYVVLFIALYLNRRLPGLKLLSVGVLLNFLVIAVNQGRMPVSGWGIQAAHMTNMLPVLKSGAYTSHAFMDGSTHLRWLGDIIPIPKPYPLPKIISVGDILMMVGVGQLVLTKMGSKSHQPSAISQRI